jgi:hypothetical protein
VQLSGAHAAVAAALIAGCVAACTLDDGGVRVGENPAQLVDTTGASFAWTCDGRGCRLGLLDETPLPPPCAPGQRSTYAYLMGRFMVITGACVSRAGWGWLREWERPVTCSSDRDCPNVYRRLHDYEYECRGGLCQNVDTLAFPAEEVSYDEAYALCLASLDREETIDPDAEASIEAAERVAQNCSATGARSCALPLPDGCLQP